MTIHNLAGKKHSETIQLPTESLRSVQCWFECRFYHLKTNQLIHRSCIFFKIWHDLALLRYWKECMNFSQLSHQQKEFESHLIFDGSWQDSQTGSNFIPENMSNFIHYSSTFNPNQQPTLQGLTTRFDQCRRQGTLPWRREGHSGRFRWGWPRGSIVSHWTKRKTQFVDSDLLLSYTIYIPYYIYMILMYIISL